jgi:uncharacterized membrane protein
LALKTTIKNYLLAGILVLVPIGVTIYIVNFLMRLMDRFLKFIPVRYHPDTYLPFHIPGLGLILLLLITILTGLLARNYVGGKLVSLGEGIVRRIPLVRGIYLSAKQLVETIATQGGQNFKRVVLIPYPHKDSYALAFLTGVATGEVQDRTNRRVLNVFVPTTPNPTSGFYLMIPEEDVIMLDISVENAFKLIMSGGIISPPKRTLQVANQNKKAVS